MKDTKIALVVIGAEMYWQEQQKKKKRWYPQHDWSQIMSEKKNGSILTQKLSFQNIFFKRTLNLRSSN